MWSVGWYCALYQNPQGEKLFNFFIVTLLLLCTMSDSHIGRPWQKSNGNRPKYSYSIAIQHQDVFIEMYLYYEYFQQQITTNFRG